MNLHQRFVALQFEKGITVLYSLLASWTGYYKNPRIQMTTVDRIRLS